MGACVLVVRASAHHAESCGFNSYTDTFPYFFSEVYNIRVYYTPLTGSWCPSGKGCLHTMQKVVDSIHALTHSPIFLKYTISKFTTHLAVGAGLPVVRASAHHAEGCGLIPALAHFLFFFCWDICHARVVLYCLSLIVPFWVG